MRATDIIEAYEAGLITRGEAAEQGLVDDVSQLYEMSAHRGGWSPRDGSPDVRAHAGR